MESFDDPLLHHPLGRNLRLLLSVENLCLSFEAFVGIAGCHSHIATLGSIAFHVDLYYKGEI